LEHAGNGDAGPAGNDLGDVFGINFFLDEHLSVRLHIHQSGLETFQLLLHFGDEAVADLGYAAKISGAFGLLCFVLQLLDPFLGLLETEYYFAFRFPLGTEGIAVLSQVGDFGGEAVELGLVVLALDGLAFDF
jgi:hypothetical protein